MIFKYFFADCQPGSDSLCGFPSFLLFNAAFLQKLVIDETLNINVGFENTSHILVQDLKYFYLRIQYWEEKRGIQYKLHLASL